MDIRLKNVSQLAGFAKRDDLEVPGRQALRDGLRAPDGACAQTQKLLDDYRKKRIDWPTYEPRFLALMEERRIGEPQLREVLDGGCLLCSEHTPERCHRRLVAEYLSQRWGDVEIVHLT